MTNPNPLPRTRNGEPTQRSRALADKEQILHRWRSGQPISAIARETGISRSVIGWLLEREGARAEVADARAESRVLRKAAVLEWVRKNPGASTNEAAAAMGINHRTLSAYLVGEPESALIVEKRSKGRDHTREGMLEALRAAWRSTPEDRRKRGLSKGLYTAFAPKQAPSPALYEKRFPTWRAACTEAGVPSPPPHRDYPRRFDEDALLDAIEAYMAQTGLTSFIGYVQWAKDRKSEAPSGPLVINRFGRWSAARRRLLDRQRLRAA